MAGWIPDTRPGKQGPWFDWQQVSNRGHEFLDAVISIADSEEWPDFPWRRHPVEETDYSPYGERPVVEVRFPPIGPFLLPPEASRWGVTEGEGQKPTLPWLAVVGLEAANGTVTQNSGFQRYDSMSVPDLHRRFAAVGPDRRGILRFANKYGLLTEGLDILTADGLGRLAEPMALWIWEINRLRAVLRIWDLFRKGKVSEFALHSSQRSSRSPVVITWPGLPPWAAPEGITTVTESEDANIRTSFMLFMYELVDRYLQFTTPFISPLHPGRTGIRTTCLLQSIYVHAALEIIGARGQMVECRECHRYFPALDTRSQYCSQACKKKYWYHHSEKSPKPKPASDSNRRDQQDPD